VCEIQLWSVCVSAQFLLHLIISGLHILRFHLLNNTTYLPSNKCSFYSENFSLFKHEEVKSNIIDF